MRNVVKETIGLAIALIYVVGAARERMRLRRRLERGLDVPRLPPPRMSFD
jgi:hypothetical protein